MIENYGVSAKTGLSIVSVLGLGVIESYGVSAKTGLSSISVLGLGVIVTVCLIKSASGIPTACFWDAKQPRKQRVEWRESRQCA